MIMYKAISPLLSGFLLLCCLGGGATAEPVQRPNFIVILTDDQGYGDLGCYGSERIKSPHLDKMAAEGIRFTDFYVVGSVCTPSRASLMTGSYPKRVGLEKVLFPDSVVKKSGGKGGELEKAGLNPSEITIAEILKEKGYATACVGKWHLGDDPKFMPNNQGFDEYFGLPYSNDMVPDQFPDLPLMRNSEVVELNPDQDQLTRRYTEESIAFIRKHKDEPFFLYLPHSMPHRAVHASAEFTKRFTEKQMNSIKPGEDKASRDFLYPAAIEEIDWSTGEILNTLRELGLEGNTLIVFTSDNGAKDGGGGSNRPLRGGKGSVFEGGNRVPGIMQWKGTIPTGTVSGEVACTMDLLPTFAAIVGADLPADRVIDGKNILPLLEAEPGVKSPHESFFYTYGGMAVRSGKWKLVKGRQSALYDLSKDIGERKNVAAQFPEVVQELDGQIEEFVAKLESDLRPAGVPD
jgi:arylsulfatase A